MSVGWEVARAGDGNVRAQVTGCIVRHQHAIPSRTQAMRTLRLRFLTGGFSASPFSSSRSFFFPLPAGAGATSMGEGVSNCSEPAPDVEASGCIFEACMNNFLSRSLVCAC